MNKPVIALSVSTLLLAASTAYLAFELYGRDAAEVLAAGTQARVTPTLEPTAVPAAGAIAVAPSAGSPEQTSMNATSNPVTQASDAAFASPKSRDAQAEATTMFARQLLARYEDSNQRPVLLEEQRALIRRQYEKLKSQLKLGEAEFAQLVTLIAEDQLQIQVNWARCAADATCDARNPPNAAIDRTQEYQAMLGSEGAEAFAQFRQSIAEREAVIQLRGRLPDNNFLPELQAERLIVALAEERTRFSQDAAARGAKTTGWGTQLGMLWYTEDSGLPEQYIVEATQYSQRLRARAAAVLTPAQLAAFSQMQDELLAQFTTNLRPPTRQRKASVAQTS